ncbi:anti-sigma factor family protein [Tundrisphaera sp. TA3]|uniref:anti-sigma factor family protein n=1 Tax=Tundrisphaera sp. TA3 TaxID=3435775 RepID=UPI003EBE9055
MVPDHQRLSSEERSNLVAYLDGELDDADSRVIATKLTQSMTARRELDALQKTWEMLDLLHRPQASEDFTERTLSIADLASGRGDRIASAASGLARRVGMVLALLLAGAALFGVGYSAVLFAWPNPTARLARDLSIAENLDELRDAGSIEFLELLDRDPDFNQDAN